MELLPSLFALASSSSIFSSASSDGTILLEPQSELEHFLTDIAKRFDKDGLEDVLGNLVRAVVFSPSLAGGMVRNTSTHYKYKTRDHFQVHSSTTAPQNLTPTSWRSAVAALEMLFGIKQIAVMITGLPEWNPTLYDEATHTGKQ